MLSAYHLVLVNVVTSVLFFVGLLFYRFIFPKRRLNLFVVLLLISLLPLISLLRKGDYESGDFNVHIYRSMVFYDSLQEGNIMPSWAGELNGTYGYPLFIFNYPLPYYVISLFHFLGFSFITSMKLFLATTFLSSGIFMYLCGEKLFANDFAAFAAAIFFLFAPYHLIDMHFKIVIGELMIFSLLPQTFYCLLRLTGGKKPFWLVFATLSTALLIMAHVVLAFFCSILFALYAVFVQVTTKKQTIFQTLTVFALSGLSTVYIWLTPFLLGKYTLASLNKGPSSFTPLSMLLYVPWRMGFLFQGPKGEIGELVGYAQLLAVTILLVLLVRKKIVDKHLKQAVFWLCSFFISIFLIIDFSAFFWRIIPFLSATGGSHRLLILVNFATAVMAGYIVLSIKKKTLLVGFIFVAIGTTILNWGHRRVIPELTDTNLREQVWGSTAGAEAHWYANTIWKDQKHPWFAKKPITPFQTIQGDLLVQALPRTSTTHTYVVLAKTNSVVQENTLYFPGWTVSDNERALPTDYHHDGVIRFGLTRGLHYLVVHYSDVEAYALTKQISLFGLMALTGTAVAISCRILLKRLRTAETKPKNSRK